MISEVRFDNFESSTELSQTDRENAGIYILYTLFQSEPFYELGQMPFKLRSQSGLFLLTRKKVIGEECIPKVIACCRSALLQGE